MERYLKCTEIIDCDMASVKDKAQELAEGLLTDSEKAVALYYFVRDEIKHNAYAPLYDRDRYKASATLHAGNGFCQQKAVLLVALARVAGIPARLGFVDVRDHQLADSFKQMIGGVDVLPSHGYAELSVNGRWVHVSPAYDTATCRRKGFVPVEFDGANDAKDSTHTEAGERHVEHIKDHGTFDDFPWEEIRRHSAEWAAELGLDLDSLKNTGEEIRHGKGWGERLLPD